jgi:sulfate permease, SulP family
MANGDPQRYAQIASLAAFTVAALCLIAWAFRLSAIVKLISGTILVGFEAGAGLTIAMTQLPSLIGVAGGGHNFFERAVVPVGHFGEIRLLVLGLGVFTIVLLVLGDLWLPGKPGALGVVVQPQGWTVQDRQPAGMKPVIGTPRAGSPSA